MTDLPTSGPVTRLSVDGVTFECWVVPLRYGDRDYEWRSVDRTCRIGKNSGNGMWWVRCGGRELGAHYVGLLLALKAAARGVRDHIASMRRLIDDAETIHTSS